MQRNTLITLSDNKIGIDQNADNKADFYTASVLSATDYYAFGMSMKERSWQSEKYRYGFNGKERDNDIENGTYDFGARLMNGGRWWSPDPLAGKYAGLSPFNFVANNPLNAIDPDGEDFIFGNQKDAEIVVKDINMIMQKKHPIIGLSNFFKVTAFVEKTKTQINKVTSDPSTWKYLLDNPIYETKETTKLGLTLIEKINLLVKQKLFYFVEGKYKKLIYANKFRKIFRIFINKPV